MRKTYRDYQPEQMFLLPPSLKEWLPEGHLAYFISDVVDNLNISEIEKDYEKELRGYPPYHPRMMLKVLIYGYCTGVRSSRKLEKKIQEDIAFRMLAAGNMPDFRTIAAFRRRHLKAFKELFLEVLKLCQKAGLVKLGHVALDGTKVKANASKHKAMSYERMKKKEAELEKEIEELIAAAEKADQREDELYGKDKRGDELPEELAIRESRLKKIREAKAALEEEARKEREAKDSSKQNDKDDNQGGAAAGEVKKPCEPKPTAQRNFTDPDSKIMPAPGGGWIQGYNAQAAVDGANQIIVAAQVSSNPSDRSQLKSMVKAIEENMGEKPERLSADAGYFSEDNIRWLIREAKVAPYIPPDKTRHGERLTSPRGPISPKMSVADRMRRKLRTKAGQAIYKLRKAIVEPVFGHIKEAMGFRQFLLRGREKVQAEWELVCLCHNLLKLFAFQTLR